RGLRARGAYPVRQGRHGHRTAPEFKATQWLHPPRPHRALPPQIAGSAVQQSLRPCALRPLRPPPADLSEAEQQQQPDGSNLHRHCAHAITRPT
ncbi:unnamed protein product, partial [Closterium sp. NIES-53]